MYSKYVRGEVAAVGLCMGEVLGSREHVVASAVPSVSREREFNGGTLFCLEIRGE